MPLEGFPWTWTAEDVANPYDPTPFTDADEETVWCRVTITLPDGTTRTATGNYLNLEGYPVMRCGIEEAADELGLERLLADTDKYVTICEWVDRDLSWRPFARLRCPELTIHIELTEPNR
ncbi:hypothetical protein [Mycolicibacterium fallax]|uniref:Uncharacterized protein n=1 Tax=Mycolicibacterium fallax TaxID=1793 RepID=A0A1X1RFJ6_MYCFA|nr:hypothetical protein [Mycolicibacterium fallax]ORV04611.1 hypothetical protein AWC04_08440 [Mycolicibacterium fallax]BBY99645.1 hypothetical protein MFAL_31120 [Mycolicibacterium fallax]